MLVLVEFVVVGFCIRVVFVAVVLEFVVVCLCVCVLSLFGGLR